MTDSLLNQNLGKYQIQSRLGDGGMGSVYLAHDTELDRDVAIKVMHPHFARQEEFRQRFRQEAQAMAKLSHGGIVQVYDFGEQDGWLYIVMEFIRGGNLRQMLDDLLQRDQWINLSEALELVRQVAFGLEYAHKQNILHRDIKPANIMVKSVPAGTLAYQPVITDLGLAKLEGTAGITATGTTMGTLSYMSPEQARGSTVDRRSDVYSLGILLYELVCGKLPFPAQTWSEAFLQHTEQPPPSLEISRPDVPADVAAIVLKALQKEPDQRFSSAAAMAAAIERLSSNDLLATVPPTAIAGATSIKTAHQQSLVSPRFQSIFEEFPSLVSAETAIQVLHADGKVETFVVNQTAFTLGRSSSNDLVINDEKASREHARIETNGQTFRVIDLGSANGTFLGNSPLLSNVPQEWKPEQALRIGQHYLRLVPAQAQSALMTKQQTIPSSGSSALQSASLYIPQNRADVQPGQTMELPIVLVNQSEQVTHFDLSVEGLPADWIAQMPTVSTMPNGTAEETISLQPPQTPSTHAQEYPAMVRAVNRDNPAQTTAAEFTLTVKPFGTIQSQLRPQKGRSGEPMRVELANQSNRPETVQLSWSDSGEQLAFDPAQGAEIRLNPGESQTVNFVPTLRKRPLVGGSKNHSIAVQVVSPESNSSQSLMGTVSSRGLAPAWVPPLLVGLLGVIAAGLVFGLDRIPSTSPAVVTGPTPGIVTPVETEADTVAQVPTQTPDLAATEAAQQTADAEVAAEAQHTADAQATAKTEALNATATAGDAQAAATAQAKANAEATATAEQLVLEAGQTATVVQAAAQAQWQTATAVQMTAEAQGTAAALETISAATKQTAMALTAEAGQTATAIQMTAEAETAEAREMATAIQMTAEAATAAANQTSTSIAATLTAEAIPTTPPAPVCTPPPCPNGDLVCGGTSCPGGCGTICKPPSGPTTVYDFVKEASKAHWTSGAGELPWNGARNDKRGFVVWTNNEVMEDGSKPSRALETHPEWVDNGRVSGTFTHVFNSGYIVDSSDKFKAKVGFLKGAGAGNATFSVMIRSEDDGNKWIGSVTDSYDEKLKTLEISLAKWAGQKADFILKVEAGSTSSQDWATWVEAKVVRGESTSLRPSDFTIPLVTSLPLQLAPAKP